MNQVEDQKSGLVKFLQYLLVLLNFFMLIAGLTSLAVGIWIVVEKKVMEYIVGSNLYTSSAYIMIAVGAIAVLLSFLGCFASIKQVKCVLITYFVCMLMLFLMMTIAGILGFVFKNQITDSLEGAMVRSLRSHYGQKNYKSDEWVTKAWDFTQEKFACCSVNEKRPNNFYAWTNSSWYKSQPSYPSEKVPASCCTLCAQLRETGFCDKVDSDEKRVICERECAANSTTLHVNLRMCQGTTSEALLVWPRAVYVNMQGCYPKVLQQMRECAVILGAVGIGASILMAMSMIISLCLYRAIP